MLQVATACASSAMTTDGAFGFARTVGARVGASLATSRSHTGNVELREWCMRSTELLRHLLDLDVCRRYLGSYAAQDNPRHGSLLGDCLELRKNLNTGGRHPGR